jgi:hypothetical protein
MTYKYYPIFFFILIKSIGSEQLIIFNPYFVNQYRVEGIATFMNTLSIENGNILINGKCQLNYNNFLNESNNKITINSNNIIINGLSETGIGINFLALDQNNNLSIIKNSSGVNQLSSNNYNIVYVKNIIGKNNMPLKIGNNATDKFFIGNYQVKTSNIEFNSYQTLINSINSIDGSPLTISNIFKSNNTLDIDGNLNISGNVFADNININQSLEITNPVSFFNMTINGNSIIENNNNYITIVENNGILNVKNNIIIQGLPLYNTDTNNFTILALDKNNSIYQKTLNESIAINAINQDLYFTADKIIFLGSNSNSIELNANFTILDNTTINNPNSIITFNFPIIFTVTNPTTISQLIFEDILTINNIHQINNLFSASNNTSISNFNNKNIENNTTFNSDQIVFMNLNTIETYDGPRLVIDQNNMIGIEALNNINKKTIRAKNNINNKIKIINDRIDKTKKNITELIKIEDYISKLEKKNKCVNNNLVSEINQFLENQ